MNKRQAKKHRKYLKECLSISEKLYFYPSNYTEIRLVYRLSKLLNKQ